MFKGKARAHTNIALIKYWGKANDELIIPMNNSLSLTLDAFYTETEVCFSETFPKDAFYLDDQLQDQPATQKVSHFLDLVRTIAKTSLKAEVRSSNFVPTAAGLASSASGLAALAGACNVALNLNLSDQELSRLARRGSGSACRSIFGGFAEWQKGSSDETSYAVALPANHWEEELAMIFILVNDQEKAVSSRDGMKRTVATSAFYPGWLETVPDDLALVKQAIDQQDFQLLGETTEANALKMHATTLGATPPFTYWSAGSLTAMQAVQHLRTSGIPAYFTMDAGPNVKVLIEKKNLPQALENLQQQFATNQLITAQAGPGIQIIR